MRVMKAYNPLCLTNDTIVADVSDGMPPNRIIESQALVFDRPFILLVNGRPLGRINWDAPTPVGCTLHFVVLPRGGGGGSNPLKILAMIVVVVLSVYTGGLVGGLLGSVLSSGMMAAGSLLVNAIFPTSSTLDSSSSGTETAETVYSLNSGSNNIRIGSPFAEQFGRMICYPDLVQAPYTSYEDESSTPATYYLGQSSTGTIVLSDDYEGTPASWLVSQVEACSVGDGDQFFYFLGIIGVGEYEVEGVYVDETPFSDFDGTAYRILAPGDTPALVPRLCWNCEIFGNQELTTDWLTGVLSGPGTEGQDIEFDIIFNGLVEYNDSGDRISCQVGIEVQVRRVDWTGAALSDWTHLFSRNYTYQTIETLRFSHRIAAPLGSGRYALRIRRTTEPSDDGQIIDACYVGGAKIFGGEHPDYGDVTMIECRIKATDTLNGSVANKINVVSTRKLQTVTSTGLSEDVAASRSIIDAVVYAVTADNGGRYPVDNIDYSALAALREDLESANYHYDWRHNSASTVMEVVKQMASLGRCLPYTPGGVFSLIQDKLQELPSISFTEDDYSVDTLTLEHTIPTDYSYTCVIVTYTDPDTWDDMEVLCYDYNGSEDIPYEVTLSGCTDRQHAFEIGMYLYNDDRLCRTKCEFVTGLKGHLPTPGAKMVVAANMVDWGQTGKVVDTDENKWLLSEPVKFQGESSGQIFVTSATGKAIGPISVRPTVSARVVEGAIPNDMRTIQKDGLAGASYLFGPASQEWLYIRLLSAQIQDQNKIKLIGDIIYDEVYSDPGIAPAPGEAPVLISELSWMNINYLSKVDGNYKYYVTWIGSATEFLIQVSDGGSYETYLDNCTDHNCLVLSESTFIAVRIVPYVDGVLMNGLAITGNTTLIAPTTLTITIAAVGLDVDWAAVSGATRYNLSILSTDGETKKTYATAYTDYFVPIADIVAADVGKEFDLKLSVVGENAVDPIIERVSLVALDAPGDFTVVALQSAGASLSWSSVAGATEYAIWLGTEESFVPSAANLVYRGKATAGVVACDTAVEDYRYYLKLAALTDIFTDESIGFLNFSELELSSSAIPCSESVLTFVSVAAQRYVGAMMTTPPAPYLMVIAWNGDAASVNILIEQAEWTYSIEDVTENTVIGWCEAGSYLVTVTPVRDDGTLCNGRAKVFSGIAEEY